ncbi:MAG: SRPBCC domain-containing protein [Actinomycetia bacterium]|nr:SRPBCC domain-containing protein [Actinomycetes bacterium]
MKLENSFQVSAPRKAAWELLLDVPRVIPCMPGAELTETVDNANWKATMSVKLGPISLAFATDVARQEVDEADSRVVLAAKAKEMRGRGGAQATIESRLSESDGRTQIDIVTDLAMSGAVAQYGRGIVQDVSAQLVKQFAECLELQLAGTAEDAEAAVEQAAKPVFGGALGAAAIFRSILRALARLLGRGPQS